MTLKFSAYDADEPRIIVGKTRGNEILAVRVLRADGTEQYTEKFEDSRHVDRALREAREVISNTSSTEVSLYCTGGCIQYAESVEAMLAEYNRNGRFYEVRHDDSGDQILWHKGHNYSIGTFKPSDRV